MAGLIGALGAKRFGLPGVLLCIPIGIVVGAVNGAQFNFLRIPSFIVTLAMMVILRALVLIISGGFAVYLDQVSAAELAALIWIGRSPRSRS